MKHYAHTITTSAAQIAHLRSQLEWLTDNWYRGATPNNVEFEVNIHDNTISVFADSAEMSYFAHHHLEQIIDAHDPFDVLWSRLKMSIIDARTAKSKQVECDRTTISVEQDKLMLVRADALMSCKITEEESINLAAMLLSQTINQ
jgi:hypothetical protein